MSYVPDDVFDVGVCTLVGFLLREDEASVDDQAADASRQYSASYRSEDFTQLRDDWAEAAKQVFSGLKKIEIEDDDIDVYRQAYWHFRTNFERDGSKKPFLKKWGGTKSPFYKGTYEPDRVKKSVQNFLTFAIACNNGMAKREWLP